MTRRRKRRSAIIHRVIKAAGGKKKLARHLRIREQSINNWRRIPRLRILKVEELTGISRAELAPDLYGIPPWW